MKQQFLIVICALALFGAKALGGEEIKASFPQKVELDDREKSAKALYILVSDKNTDEPITKASRLVFAASVCNTYSSYLQAKKHISAELEEFVDSADATNAIRVLIASTMLLDKTVLPEINQARDMMSLVGVGGQESEFQPMATGMDSKAIKDTKLREAYEKILAKQAQAMEVINSHWQLKRAIEELERTINGVEQSLGEGEKASAFNNLILTSILPPQKKEMLLHKSHF
jgi:hypothetical protein